MTCTYCDKAHVCVTEGDREPVCYEHLLSPPVEGLTSVRVPGSWRQVQGSSVVDPSTPEGNEQ